MTISMDEKPSSRLVQRLLNKNAELNNRLQKSAQFKVPSDIHTWEQKRENYEAILLEDHDFAEEHEIEFHLWQLHYKKIEEFRLRVQAGSQAADNSARSERIKKIRPLFKVFLSESTGYYHDLMLKIRAKYGLPPGCFGEGPENQFIPMKDEKKSVEMKKGFLSCHRCLIYLGDLARYIELYGGDSVSRDFAAASSYYTQAASLWPSSGNPHHQLGLLAKYSGDELVEIYRFFRSLAVDCPFTMARDNLILAFEKNRLSYSHLPRNNSKVPPARVLPARSAGKGRVRGDYRLPFKDGDAKLLARDTKAEVDVTKEVSAADTFKTFSIRFVRLNGILFTRTSLETFGEVFSSVIFDLNDLLSSSPEEMHFGSDAAGNGMVIVRLVIILIFTVYNLNRESNGLSPADIVQRSVLLQNAFTAAFEFSGHILKRCSQLSDVASSFFLPGILVFIEWLACWSDIATGFDVDEKQAAARTFFWNQFVEFMNKLTITGIVSVDENEDECCFFDMSQYDDEAANRLALWEDFELRGFFPLVPSHSILDFSRRHTFQNDGSNKEKHARVQRVFAAGRVLMNIVRVEQKGIYFDRNLKKFVIAMEPPAYEVNDATGLSERHEFVKQNLLAQNASNNILAQSNVAVHTKQQLYVSGEDDDEEIVFKPTTLNEKNTNTISLVPIVHDTVKSAQSYSNGEWAAYGGPFSAPLSSIQMSGSVNESYCPTSLSSGQIPSANFTYSIPHTMFKQSQQISPNIASFSQESTVSEGLKSLSVVENGMLKKHDMQERLLDPSKSTVCIPFPNLHKVSYNSFVVDDAKDADVIPSKLDSIFPAPKTLGFSAAGLPSISRNNPVSRPIKHFGPPPGFSNAPFKQADEIHFDSVGRQQPYQVDDYTWLDDYKPASKVFELEKCGDYIVNSLFNGPANSITLSDATSFPFPGKQTLNLSRKHNEFWLSDQAKPYFGQQPPHIQTGQTPQYNQAEFLWGGRNFV